MNESDGYAVFFFPQALEASFGGSGLRVESRSLPTFNAEFPSR